MQAFFLNPVNGDATLLVLPSGKTVLVDGGIGSEGKKIVRSLVTLGIEKLDAVILTHPDVDHYSGLAVIFKAVEVNAFYHSGLESWTPQYKAFRRKIRGCGSSVHKIRKGDSVDLDPDVTCSVLWPPVDTKGSKLSSHFANTSSLLLKIKFGDISFLLTGDIKDDSEAILVQESGLDLKAEVLKVAHHGSKSSSSEAFLQRIKPKIAVIMGERFNIEPGAFRRPAEETLRRLEEVDSKVVRTWKSGVLLIETDGRSVTKILTERDSVEP